MSTARQIAELRARMVARSDVQRAAAILRAAGVFIADALRIIRAALLPRFAVRSA